MYSEGVLLLKQALSLLLIELRKPGRQVSKHVWAINIYFIPDIFYFMTFFNNLYSIIMKLMSVSLDNISVETECGSSLCEILQKLCLHWRSFSRCFQDYSRGDSYFPIKKYHFLILFLLFEIGKKECYTSFLIIITCIYFNFPSL